MRISAPGRADPGWAPAFAGALPRKRESGFTLVELLVVITIIAMLSTVVVLALPGDSSALRSDAEDFAGRAKAIRDKAMIDARATSIRVTSLGYAFDERSRGGWKPTNGDVTQGLLWREGTQAAIPLGETIRIVFDSTGIAEPARVTLQRGDRRIAVTIAYDGTIDVAA